MFAAYRVVDKRPYGDPETQWQRDEVFTDICQMLLPRTVALRLETRGIALVSQARPTFGHPTIVYISSRKGKGKW